MAGLPKEIADFMERYGVEADQLWPVREGVYAIKHKALERVAIAQGIVFDPPVVLGIDLGAMSAAFIVTARMGERVEWTTGEASPKNNKNAYFLAMAEKRGKDRATLKLLQAHGDLYSEDELEDAKRENGKPTQLAKKDAREIYSKLQAEIDGLTTREQAKLWAEGNKARKDMMPDDWQGILELRFSEKMLDLKQRETA